ncbi:unnamed protein product [Dracunculus medinensis]|uniref:ASH domain-containing protein n=1 Tax=Dracunculus medinensis TaxID=318479 RepID=A0A0N4UNB4_DRAME|nr:unnamed protein product [Dracunculus medinensis]
MQLRLPEKSESGGSIDFGRVGNIRERSKNFQNIDFQKNNGSRLLLDSVRFPLSNSSLCDGARNEIRERCLSFDTTFVYFGFVDVHCQVNRFLRIRNRSNKNLNLLIQLKSNNKDSVFRLVDTEIMMLRPEDSHSIKILFEPKLAACFRDTLCIRVMNANHVNYSLSNDHVNYSVILKVPMMGSGGIANLQICQRAGINMLRDGSFVFSTQGYSSFTFDIKNKGVRDAFVRIVVFDKKTKKPFQNVEILPSDCITILRCKTQRCLLKFDSEAAVGHSESALSLISVSSSAPSYYVHLLWGEEAQRRRLKRYEANKKIDLFFNGYTFTKPKFLNEEQSKITASESIEVGHYDNDSFELGLRIISISLVDNRLNNFSSRQYEEQSENRQTERSIILDPDATLRPGCNNIVVEDNL